MATGILMNAKSTHIVLYLPAEIYSDKSIYSSLVSSNFSSISLVLLSLADLVLPG